MRSRLRTKHLSYNTGGTWSQDFIRLRIALSGAITVVTGSISVVILHNSWITHTIVGGRNSNTPTGFLDHDRKNKAVIKSCFESD